MAELTTKQYALREQVTRRTVERWIAKGAIVTRKTPGGQHRVYVPDPPLLILNPPPTSTDKGRQ